MAVATVERNYAIAYDKSSGAYTVGYQQTCKVSTPRPALTPAPAPTPTPTPAVVRYSLSSSSDEGNSCGCGNVAVFIFFLLISLGYGTSAILGYIFNKDCPNFNLALYTIVQGSVVMLNVAINAFWFLRQCCGVKVILACTVLLGLFNITWLGLGITSLSASECRGHQLQLCAVVPTSMMFLVLMMICCCYRRSRFKD